MSCEMKAFSTPSSVVLSSRNPAEDLVFSLAWRSESAYHTFYLGLFNEPPASLSEGEVPDAAWFLTKNP